MKLDQIVLKRLDELLVKADQVERTAKRISYEAYVDSSLHQQWATSVLNILQRVFGESSAHYKNFLALYNTRGGGDHYGFLQQVGVLRAAKEDYEGGYLFNLKSLISAEILDDALEQAAEFLRTGYKDAACVTAGIALETGLKRLCDREGIPQGKLDRMNADLAKKDLYNVSLQKQITAWAGWRNNAAHGNWTAYTKDDVEDMLKGINRFIANYL